MWRFDESEWNISRRGRPFRLPAGAATDYAKRLSSGVSNVVDLQQPGLQFMVPKVMAREFEKVGFRLDMAYKDIRQATALAREMSMPLLAANGATELLQLARALGFGSQDSTAMVRGLETILRVEVRGRGRA